MANSVAPFPSRGGALVAALGFALLLPAGPPTAAGAPQTLAEGAAPPAAAPPAAAPPAGGAPEVAPAGGVDFARDREAIFEAFYSVGLDTGTAYTVSNLAVKKDNVTLLLKQGTVFLAQPIAGEVTGAAFVGDGEISMTPPNRTERYMLKKHYGAEVLKEPFSEAVFRFSDDTHRTILGAGKGGEAGVDKAPRAQSIFAERNGWLNGTRELDLEMQFLENRISGLRDQEFFLVDLRSEKHEWLTYRHFPRDFNENALTASATLGAKGSRYLIPWTEWHDQQDYAPSGHYGLLPERDGPRALRVRHNTMDINLKNTKTVAWEAKLRIEPLLDGLMALRFDLVNSASLRWNDESFYVARVDSIATENGEALPFTHLKDNLLILLPSPSRAGVEITLVAKGSADMVYQLTAESFGIIQAPWYPWYGFVGGRTPFHWTVRVPKPFLITGSGKVVREFQEKGQNGIEVRCDEPVRLPWIIFGRFQKASDTYTSEETKRSINLTIHSFPTMTGTIYDREVLEELGLDEPLQYQLSAPLKKVAGIFDEGKQILKLYEKIYGPYPFEELHIAQMGPFLGFGQAPQGFVQLTGEAFMSQARLESDFFHGFLAHEFAHQWWAHQVGWPSHDDDWISESFAEYASGIFVRELQGEKRFQRELDDWRRDAKYSDKEAPIAAASTLRGPNGGRHRSNLLYNKGPYVLHMLRVQLNDEKYVEVMRALQQTYRHQDVTTEMLVREVNRITGSNLTYFFDQWVWDVGIPTFRYRWRSEKQPDGKFLITVNVRQDDKDHVKKVLMPVHIHFKDKMIPQYRPVVQAEQEIKILSPMEPKNVTLDDDRTLLAEFVKES